MGVYSRTDSDDCHWARGGATPILQTAGATCKPFVAPTPWPMRYIGIVRFLPIPNFSDRHGWVCNSIDEVIARCLRTLGLVYSDGAPCAPNALFGTPNSHP
jgi:hypothetical protein